jgi:UDP-N-acetylmuramoyl-tripeptide--D-alanyl-D-alanine ligase
MNAVSLAEIAVMCGADVPVGGGDLIVGGISKDTRTLAPGDLYVGLRGDHFNGNAFANEAAKRGAVAALLDDPAAALPAGFPVLRVQDSLAALQRLAGQWRQRLSARVVCITGSNGKTSTKDFAASVMRTRFATSATSGNLNNHIGVPLSVLAASTSDAVCVWEVGMNHAGEIAPLAALAKPDVSIITGIGVAHIENLGSREAIAMEKAGVFEALEPGGLALLPAECDFGDILESRSRGRVERVGGPGSRVRAEELVSVEGGIRFVLVADGDKVPVSLGVPGRHMVSNALLAVAAGLEMGISPFECAEGLAAARLAAGRLARKEIRGVRFLDDTYNANPDSMEAALAVLASAPGAGRRLAVFGKMGELGAYAAEGYRRVGLAAARCCSCLIAVGAETEPMAVAARGAGLSGLHAASTPEEAASILRDVAAPGDIVLVKGSRSARMEHVITNF